MTRATHGPRGIDHLVLAVRDLAAAEAFYRRLGFTLTPRAFHPWGTANHLAQFEGSFLELLAVADASNIPPAASGHFSFGAYNRDFLARREGFSMLVFDSRDARADRDAFARAGLADLAPFDFAREAKLPDGTTARVAFSLAFAIDPRLPEATCFTCQQHAPQHFWKIEYQRHANGATAVAEVLMVAPDPRQLAEFFASLGGRPKRSRRGSDLTVATSRGQIRIHAPDGFAARFPGARIAAAPRTPYFAGYRLTVADPARVVDLLRDNGVPHRFAGGVVQVMPEQAFNVGIEFAAR